MHRHARYLLSSSAAGRSSLVTQSLARYRLRFGDVRNAHSESSAGDEDGASQCSGKDSHYQREHQASSDTAEPEAFSIDFEHRIPSNQARPALSDEYLHSGADEQHPKKPGREDKDPNEVNREEHEKEDVRRHNEDVERRYDRAFEQVTQEGERTTLGEQGDMDQSNERK